MINDRENTTNEHCKNLVWMEFDQVSAWNCERKLKNTRKRRCTEHCQLNHYIRRASQLRPFIAKARTITCSLCTFYKTSSRLHFQCTVAFFYPIQLRCICVYLFTRSFYLFFSSRIFFVSVFHNIWFNNKLYECVRTQERRKRNRCTRTNMENRKFYRTESKNESVKVTLYLESMKKMEKKQKKRHKEKNKFEVSAMRDACHNTEV